MRSTLTLFVLSVFMWTNYVLADNQTIRPSTEQLASAGVLYQHGVISRDIYNLLAAGYDMKTAVDKSLAVKQRNSNIAVEELSLEILLMRYEMHLAGLSKRTGISTTDESLKNVSHDLNCDKFKYYHQIMMCKELYKKYD